MMQVLHNPRLATYRMLKRLEVSVRTAVSRVHPNPLFIFGNQKSGTSAIAALIGASTDLEVLVDLPREVMAPTVPEVHAGRRTLDWFIRRNRLGFSHPVIKEPALTFLAGMILEHWQDSPSIFVMRHPYENIRSILDRLRISGDLSVPPAESLDEANPAWKTVLDNRWLGVESQHYIEQLAWRWVLAARVYLDLRDRMVLARYEDFERDKVGVIKDLVRQVGFEPLSSIEHLVDHQFQPAGVRGRTPAEVFGGNLALIDDICWPLAGEFGYDRSETGAPG